MAKIFRLSLALAASLAFAEAAFAQTIEIVTDEAALFGDASDAGIGDAAAPAATDAGEDALFQDDGIETVAQSAADPAAALRTNPVRIGGTFSGSAGADFGWTDPWNGNRDPLSPDTRGLPTNLAATVFLDARPEENVRIFASVKTGWPFQATKSFLTGASLYDTDPVTSGLQPGQKTTTGSVSVPNLKVFELFSDFVYDDRLFFRFGKHTVKWGVGYFWSPADVLNLTAIDVADPTAQREGPISLRVQYPLMGTQTNFWGYLLIPNVADPSKLEPEDLGAAGKAEFLVGNWELGLGAFYQRDLAPKAMLTATGSLGQVDLFGEAVLGWGSDKLWVTDAAAAITAFMTGGSAGTTQYDTGAYFSGTAGFMWMKSDWDLTVAGQYFFNGDGYADAARKDLIADAHAYVDALPPGMAQASDVLKGLIYNSGRHYAGLSVSKSKLGLDDLSLSLLAVANLSDLSGMVKPSLSYRFFDKLSANLGATFYWAADAAWGGGADGEYVVLAGGPSVSLSISASLGGGKF
jgi:hypothetical protein